MFRYLEKVLVSTGIPSPDAPAGAGRYLLSGGLLLACWFLLYRSLLPFSKWFTYTLVSLAPDTRLGAAVEFFVYDGPKVLLLLTLVVFGVGIVRSYFTPERARQILAGKREAAGNVMAALLGIVTPFCSCSAVPLFIGFVTSGVPLGVTFSFLVSAPMVNEVALVLLYGLFGWKIAALYLGTGLVIAMVSGWVIGRLGMERYVEEWVYAIPSGGGGAAPGERLSWRDRIRYGIDAVRDIVGKVWPYVLAGIGVEQWGRGRWIVFWSRLAAAGGGAMTLMAVAALTFGDFDSRNLEVLSWGLVALGAGLPDLAPQVARVADPLDEGRPRHQVSSPSRRRRSATIRAATSTSTCAK